MLWLQVSMQRNGTDCGVPVIHYMTVVADKLVDSL